MFTYKYKGVEYIIFTEYYQSCTTYTTHYHGEILRQRFIGYSEHVCKKHFKAFLRDVVENPTQYNIFIEK